MNKNLQIILLISIVLAFGALIFYYSLRSKSPPPLTEEQKMQALIDSTTAPANSTLLSEKELKKLIDSTTAPTLKTVIIDN